MLDARQLYDNVIVPTLKSIGLYSKDAADLVLGTFLIESSLIYIRQKPAGVGRGLGQCEPTTYTDIITRIQKPKYADTYSKILSTLNMQSLPESADALMGNITLMVIITRLKYATIPASIPTTLEEKAAYYKKYYNTPAGAAKASDYIRLYNLYGIK